MPKPFTTTNASFFNKLADAAEMPEAIIAVGSPHPWSVYCNACDKLMDNVHFHCSVCDDGDYDLCEECVAGGTVCPGEGHWLIKRTIENGKVVASTTERIPPRVRKMRVEDMLQPEQMAEPVESKKEMPGAFADDAKTLTDEPRMPTRTCNSCVIVLPEREFITCDDCDDYDLCIPCHGGNKHGHNPAHTFKPATEETVLPMQAANLLAAGRNVRHEAICDGCDKAIFGVRHKCLNCPDWDYCNDCVKNARQTHPRHRFAPIYAPIPFNSTPAVRHAGIYCDGPLCSGKPNQAYIKGVRYKCAVCHDTDFCETCEALPGNHHNRTHPLIKFKTPVRNVSITTENADQRGNVRMMGDRRAQQADRGMSTVSQPMPVRTMAEIEPTEAEPGPMVKEEEEEEPTPVPATLLNAHFVSDSTRDGTAVQPSQRFTQIWTLKNVGPYPWPAGCSVRYVGGDNMLNVDNTRPASVTDIARASESNVVGREVQVGEEIAFKVDLKAPEREGKAISYWRLKAADGTPFGHRLWCDVDITKPAAAQPFPFQQQLPIRREVPMPPQVPTSLYYNFPGMQQQDPAPSALRPRMPTYGQQHIQMITQHQAPMQYLQRMQAQQQRIRMQQEPHGVQMNSVFNVSQMAEKASAVANVAGTIANDAGPAPPPSYAESNQTLHARLAAMRLEQQKRRESMFAQMQARVAAQQQQQQHVPAQAQQSASPPPPLKMKCGRARQYSEHAAASNSMTEDDKARKEAARQRVEHIKAKILRGREERARAAMLAAAAEKNRSLDLSAGEGSSASASSTSSSEKVKKIIDNVVADDAQADAEMKKDEMQGSQMVFPKLEKESPSSSTTTLTTSNKGKAAYVENEEGVVERSATPSSAVATPAPISEPIASPTSTVAPEFEYEEIEVLSANGEEEEAEVSESDDGFLTDEEYDILDGSDGETVA